MYLDKPHKITRESIRTLTSLCMNEMVLVKKMVENNTINALTRLRLDGRVMIVEDIKYLGVKYVTKYLSSNVYFQN